MRNWYSSVNASPGLTNESFETLRKKADEVKNEAKAKLLCNLMMDEMSIRRHAQWNAAKMKFDGFVDVGGKVTDQNCLPLAKDALVYLITGVEDDFKIPIAYFLTNGLTADERAAITNEILSRLSEIGIEVVSITFDGLPANIAMCKAFNIDYNYENPYIFDPADGHRKIYIILDAPHMLKLARNCIGTRNLIDGDGGIISWKYFTLLFEAQSNLPWNLGNKLTKAHIQWDKKKMSVQLAAETLSYGVAESMEFMQQECKNFTNVDSTIKYIRTIKDIFRIMNSTKSKKSEGFEQPITKLTAPTMFQRFEKAMEYLKQLKVEGESKTIFSSSINTAFVGFHTNMVNFKNIFEEYVLTGRINEIITHRFSQDHLESFFGSVRSMGGKLFLLISVNSCASERLQIAILIFTIETIKPN